MIKLDSVSIDGLKCFEISIAHHHHGGNVRPTVHCSIAYLIGNRSVGVAKVEEFSETISDLAEALVSAIENEFMQHLGGDVEMSETEVKEKIQGLVREF